MRLPTTFPMCPGDSARSKRPWFRTRRRLPVPFASMPTCGSAPPPPGVVRVSTALQVESAKARDTDCTWSWSPNLTQTTVASPAALTATCGFAMSSPNTLSACGMAHVVEEAGRRDQSVVQWTPSKSTHTEVALPASSMPTWLWDPSLPAVDTVAGVLQVPPLSRLAWTIALAASLRHHVATAAPLLLIATSGPWASPSSTTMIGGSATDVERSWGTLQAPAAVDLPRDWTTLSWPSKRSHTATTAPAALTASWGTGSTVAPVVDSVSGGLQVVEPVKRVAVLTTESVGFSSVQIAVALPAPSIATWAFVGTVAGTTGMDRF